MFSYRQCELGVSTRTKAAIKASPGSVRPLRCSGPTRLPMQQNFIRMIAATILVLICALPAPAAELPSRKPGLLEVKTSIGNSHAPARVIQQCNDAATDQMMQSSAGPVALTACARRH